MVAIVEEFNIKINDIEKELNKIDDPEKRLVINLCHVVMGIISSYMDENDDMETSDYVALCVNILANLSANILLPAFKMIQEKYFEEAAFRTLNSLHERTQKSLIHAFTQYLSEKESLND